MGFDKSKAATTDALSNCSKDSLTNELQGLFDVMSKSMGANPFDTRHKDFPFVTLSDRVEYYNKQNASQGIKFFKECDVTVNNISRKADLAGGRFRKARVVTYDMLSDEHEFGCCEFPDALSNYTWFIDGVLLGSFYVIGYKQLIINGRKIFHVSCYKQDSEITIGEMTMSFAEWVLYYKIPANPTPSAISKAIDGLNLVKSKADRNDLSGDKLETVEYYYIVPAVETVSTPSQESFLVKDSDITKLSNREAPSVNAIKAIQDIITAIDNGQDAINALDADHIKALKLLQINATVLKGDGNRGNFGTGWKRKLIDATIVAA